MEHFPSHAAPAAPHRRAHRAVEAPAAAADQAASASRVETTHPGYAGDVAPGEAWQLVQAGNAALVDVRTGEELHWVGRVPGALHVEWAIGRDQVRNEHFLEQLAANVPKDRKVLFICRSGARSVSAAKAATGAGYRCAWNVSQGFDGPLDAQKHRGRIGGWRAAGLPWLQS
jgi:rhodanese-related sulfurtransferase